MSERVAQRSGGRHCASRVGGKAVLAYEQQRHTVTTPYAHVALVGQGGDTLRIAL